VDAGFWLLCAPRGSSRGPNAAHLQGKTFIMGRFDSRKTKKTRRRRAQSKKKARDARRAEETKATRQGKS
jgi:hypothetical protein